MPRSPSPCFVSSHGAENTSSLCVPWEQSQTSVRGSYLECSLHRVASNARWKPDLEQISIKKPPRLPSSSSTLTFRCCAERLFQKSLLSIKNPISLNIYHISFYLIHFRVRPRSYLIYLSNKSLLWIFFLGSFLNADSWIYHLSTSFIPSGQFKFLVGPQKKEFTIHASLVTAQSKALNALFNGDMKEAQ